MNVLVIGGGGREHALAWKLRQSPRVKQVFIAPGNAGTAQVGRNVEIKLSELDQLLNFARRESIDLTVVGPDDVLAAGIVDLLKTPDCESLAPAKKRPNWNRQRVSPSASWSVTEFQQRGSANSNRRRDAKAALDEFGFPLAVKADGLALGKGVVIAQDRSEAETAIDDMIERRRFGDAGRKVVIEEFLSGRRVLGPCLGGRSLLPALPHGAGS